MWKYIKFGLGILLMLMSVTGSISLFSGEAEEAGRRIVENGVNTDGVVDKISVTTWGARKGWVGAFGRYYTMSYSFTTLEGEIYSKEVEITKAQANSAYEGEKIRVRYYSKQPSISTPLGYKKYMSAKEAQDVPYGTMIFSMLLFFSGGAWLTWSNWRRIRPAQTSTSVAARMTAAKGQPSASAQPAASAPGGAAARAGGFGRR